MTPPIRSIVPPVPLIVRLALSFVCILVSKAGFALAGWITRTLRTQIRQRLTRS